VTQYCNALLLKVTFPNTGDYIQLSHLSSACSEAQTSDETKAKLSKRTHLVFLFEAVALGALHLRDVLEKIGHADGRMKLSRLIWDVHRLTLLVGVSMRLNQAAGLAVHGVVFV